MWLKINAILRIVRPLICGCKVMITQLFKNSMRGDYPLKTFSQLQNL